MKNGYCLMIGGPEKLYKKVLPLIRTLAPKNGYLYCGPAGAGHFVKMIHNGIEYGMMSAIGEGFALLDASPYAGSFDYAAISRLWNQGSVVRSWLMELAERAFIADPRLSAISGTWMTREKDDGPFSRPLTLQFLSRLSRPRSFSVLPPARIMHSAIVLPPH